MEDATLFRTKVLKMFEDSNTAIVAEAVVRPGKMLALVFIERDANGKSWKVVEFSDTEHSNEDGISWEILYEYSLKTSAIKFFSFTVEAELMEWEGV